MYASRSRLSTSSRKTVLASTVVGVGACTGDKLRSVYAELSTSCVGSGRLPLLSNVRPIETSVVVTAAVCEYNPTRDVPR